MSLKYCTIFLTSQKHHAVTLPNLFPSCHVYQEYHTELLKLWNSLLAELQQAYINFQRFKRLLKTFLFGCWYNGALWL